MTEYDPEQARQLVQALAEPFDACELEFKTEPYPAVYIDARTMVARLNRVLPGGWSFVLATAARRDEKGNVSRDGTLTLHFPWGQRDYESTGTESADLAKGEPKAEKGADSDAFKRACFRAGIGSYIYELPKTLKSPALTAAQVEQAARLAGYEGQIRPEHYGPMNKARVVQPEEAPPKANGNGHTPDGYALRDEYIALCKEARFASKAHLDQWMSEEGLSTATAAGVAEAIAALRRRIADSAVTGG